ncbi:hypothetical protein [Kitasatospora paranensis]|uniref:Uncharacterized protein n=1 Tax=Kitasatospora paranensis TaxID=258053 RepID=A0ABW2FSP2_9ACTN
MLDATGAQQRTAAQPPDTGPRPARQRDRLSTPGGLAALSLDAMIHRSYARIGERLELGRIPGPVTRQRSLVVVPVTAITRLTRDALCAAVSLGDEVLAVTVVHTAPDTEDRQAAGVPPASGRGYPRRRDWELWRPGVPLVEIPDAHRRLGRPIAAFVDHLGTERTYDRITVLIPEVEPARLWQRALQNQRGAVIDRALRRHTDAAVRRLRLRMQASA